VLRRLRTALESTRLTMNHRRFAKIVRALLVGVAVAAAIDGWRFAAARRVNAQIEAGVGATAETAPASELRFAQAHALAASGATDAALNRYAALHDDPVIGSAARYNSANLLLRQAIVIRAGDQPGQALALIELAKENYREILRHQPQDWDARYNLERAQRLVADPEDGDDAPPEVRRDAERAATTMRGFSPGLP
jgi:mxaK protein